MNEKIYISGQMTDLVPGDEKATREEYIARFMKAEQLLRAEGYIRIVNPVRFFICKHPWLFNLIGYKLTILYDLWRLMNCDRIYLIPGWEESRGAKIESFVAYNMKIRRLVADDKERIDKKMSKWLWERNKKAKP